MNDRQMNVCYKLHRSQEDESRIVSFVKSYLQNLKVKTDWNTNSFSIENLNGLIIFKIRQKLVARTAFGYCILTYFIHGHHKLGCVI